MFKNLNLEALGISGCDSEVIGLVLSNGFKGFDLDLVEFGKLVAAQGFARASRLITSARLKIGSFVLPTGWQESIEQHQADLAGLPALAEIAQQLGCTRATTHIEPASERRPYHENFEYHRHRLAEVAEALRPYKIHLGVGFLAPKAMRGDRPFQFMQTFDEILLLLRSIDAPNVGLALDTWHWHLGGGKLESLRSLSADKFVTVSVADTESNVSAADADEDSRAWSGASGAIDNAAVLTALAELGYDGPVTPLVGKLHLAGQGRDRLVKQAATSLDAVWKAAGLNNAGRLATVKGR